MSYYEPRVEKIEAFHFSDYADWHHIVKGVRPYGFEVTFTDKDGNPTTEGRGTPHHAVLTLHTFAGGVQAEVGDTIFRKEGNWQAEPTREFNQKWEPSKIEPGFSRG